MLNRTEYKYKFSIIMAIYNVEDYLKEAIESIINQSIGFVENVQLILVNDGSPDNSERICMEYKEKYPNNVIYVKKENGGVASARNVGLQYREGKYINFCDSDDILTWDTLKEVDKFFEKYYNIIPYVAIPLYFFEAKTGLHWKYKFLENKNRVVNLDVEPYNFTLSSASTFYKTELFEKFKFNEEYKVSEDVELNCLIQEEYHSLGYVCEQDTKYMYRKRIKMTSLIDRINYEPDNFWIVTKIFHRLIKGRKQVPNYIKEYVLYELRSRIHDIKKEIFENQDEYNEIINEYRYIIGLIDDGFIETQSRMLESKNAKYIFLSNVLKKDDVFQIGENGFIKHNGYNLFPITNFEVKLMKTELLKDKIRLELLFWNYNNKNIDLIARNRRGKRIGWEDIKTIKSPYDQKYGEFVICPTIRYVLEIPYKKQYVFFYIRNTQTGAEYKVNDVNLNNKFPKFELKDTEIRLFHKDFNVKFTKKAIVVKQFKYSGLKYNIHTFRHIKKKYNFRAYFRLLNRRKKKYILVNDRPEKAGDNGEAIFKYINKNEKDIAKHTYFVISKKSKDYKRLKKIGKVVKKDSLKHKYLFLQSKAILSSHTHPLFINAFETEKIKYYNDLFNYKFVWLQHGITENDVSKAANIYNSKYDYMVVSTNKERQELKQEKYMIYDKKRLILNGLPRYDYLQSKPKKIISIAPTWRRHLTGKMTEKGCNEIIAGFEDSQYYREYSKFLKDKELYKMLKQNDFTLQFLLHPGMTDYENYFEQYANDRIKIIKVQDVNYQKVFEESHLFITDYSSTAFDFAYLKKPLIYFQFDKDIFFGNHYKKGIFSYETDGMGKVVYTEEDLIDKIKYYFENDFEIEKVYLDRINNTYAYNDRNNCKRLINFLKKKKILK